MTDGGAVLDSLQFYISLAWTLPFISSRMLRCTCVQDGEQNGGPLWGEGPQKHHYNFILYNR